MYFILENILYIYMNDITFIARLKFTNHLSDLTFMTKENFTLYTIHICI